MNPWPTSVFGFPVVHSPIGTAGTLEAPVNLALHTTEGPEDGDPRPTFQARGDAPTWAVSGHNGGTIWQTRGLNEWAAALRHGTIPPGQDSPNAHAVQIEICGRSSLVPWQPKPSILARVAAVMAYSAQFHGIPLVVPNPAWKDDCSDMPLPWAADNKRRQWASSGNWPKVRGVWGHVEVPWQDPTWHYDPGAMRRTVLIAAAKALLEKGEEDMTDEQAAQLAETRRGVSDQATINEQIYRRACLADPALPRLAADFDALKDPWPKGALDVIAKAIVG